MSSRVLNVLILLATITLGVIAVRWADREFQRVEPPSENFRPVARPWWMWTIHRPYRRLQHAWTWVCAAVTLGAGAVALDPKTWKRPVDPGTVIVVVALLVSGVTIANYLLASPAIFRRNGDCYGLINALEYRVPGAILGTWAVTFGRKAGWRGRLVGWMWMAGVGMLIAYGILFG